ncbi:MAG TPA: porin [Anaeromyxobacteraceae bacterium]|nr:porin [Anaeromyxobacteraceae bacterium]
MPAGRSWCRKRSGTSGSCPTSSSAWASSSRPSGSSGSRTRTPWSSPSARSPRTSPRTETRACRSSARSTGWSPTPSHCWTAPRTNGITETDQDSNKEGAARIFLTPFARSGLAPLEGLGIGVSGTWGAPTGTAASPQLPTYLSPGQNTIFAYASGTTGGAPDLTKTVVAAGDHVRWDVQGYYYAGPLGLQGEYIDSRQRVKKGATALDADHRAWAVTASFVLTGERATYRMIVPDRPFDPATGRWGALELAGRYQWIRFDDALFVNDVFADARQQVRGAHAWGAGINWYLDRSFRIMLDYDRTGFLGGASSGGQEIDRTPEQVLIGRAQIVF